MNRAAPFSLIGQSRLAQEQESKYSNKIVFQRVYMFSTRRAARMYT